MATASCFASGLQDRASGCSSLELIFLGAGGLALGEILAVGVADADAAADDDAAAIGEAMGRPLLIGSITAPWLGSATATIVPSALIAIGPSSGPSFSGNGCRRPASAFSQYQAPVPKARTATRAESPGAAPSVKNAVWSGGRDRTLSGPAAWVRSNASTS